MKDDVKDTQGNGLKKTHDGTGVHVRSSVRKIERCVYASSFLFAKVSFANEYKRRVDALCAELVVALKDVFMSAHAEKVHDVLRQVSHLEGLLKLAAVSNVIQKDMYALVHSVLVSAASELRQSVHDGSLQLLSQQSTAPYVNELLHEDFNTTQCDAPESQKEGASGSASFLRPAARQPRSVQVRRQKSDTAAVTRSQRSDEILSFIQTTGTVTVPQVASHFTGVSGKTIQRELVALLASGRITKSGDRRWTTYMIPSRATDVAE